MTKEEREDFNCNASADLHQRLLAARRAGKRYQGKLVSCTMAFEMGAKFLLDDIDDDEDRIQQDIEDISTQESMLAQQKKLKLDQLHAVQVGKAAKMDQAAQQNDNVQKLADRILAIWDNVTIYNKRAMIGSLINIDKIHLTRPKLEAVFPKIPTPKPSLEVVIKIAYELLEGEAVGA